MANKHTFSLHSRDKRRDLPTKIIIGRQDTETLPHVILKLLGFVLFHRERLLLEVNLHDHSIPFVPDLVQLDFHLRPALWVECGECSVTKLDKLAVKTAGAEIWVLKRSSAALDELRRMMVKADLRRDRYDLAAFDSTMFEEMCSLVTGRDELTWVNGGFDPPFLQFDFNGLWFDAPFHRERF